MNHRRRRLLLGTSASLVTTGCLDTLSEEAEDRRPNETDDLPSSPSDCSLRGELVDDPPAEASVVDADELADNALLERLFEAARDPDRRNDESTERPSGEYDSVDVRPESMIELEDARELLDDRPSLDDEHPPGVYVADGDLTLAITLECNT